MRKSKKVLKKTPCNQVLNLYDLSDRKNNYKTVTIKFIKFYMKRI